MPLVMPVGQFIRSLTYAQFFGTRWIRCDAVGDAAKQNPLGS